MHRDIGVVFVLHFKGDIRASQVAKLREEVTAVLGQANQERGDSVVVQLDSGGGTVTGYGLGASQLARIKVGTPLTSHIHCTLLLCQLYKLLYNLSTITLFSMSQWVTNPLLLECMK